MTFLEHFFQPRQFLLEGYARDFAGYSSKITCLLLYSDLDTVAVLSYSFHYSELSCIHFFSKVWKTRILADCKIGASVPVHTLPLSPSKSFYKKDATLIASSEYTVLPKCH